MLARVLRLHPHRIKKVYLFRYRGPKISGPVSFPRQKDARTAGIECLGTSFGWCLVVPKGVKCLLVVFADRYSSCVYNGQPKALANF